MNHRFCGVFKFQRQMYIQRQADANGPGVAIFPPKPLYKGLSLQGFADEIESALRDYKSLGRSIYADEWEQLNRQLLSYFGERSVSSFERKKKEVAIRYEDRSGEFMLFVGNNGRVLAEVRSAQDAARAIYEYLGEPSTVPIA